MSVWTFNGTAAADLRISGVQRTLRSRATDTLSFVVAQAADSAPIFAHGASVRVLRNDVGFFTGRVTGIEPVADAQGERVLYTLSGPWWYLDHCIFEVEWKVWDGAWTTASTSRVILGQDVTGARLTVAQQVAQIVQHAVDRGAPMDIGTISAAVTPPLDEATDLTCDEAIQRMLRWAPDAVSWFDYTPTKPVLHIRRHSELTVVSISLAQPVNPTPSTARIIEHSISPLHDLQIPGIRIRFERTDEADGANYSSVAEQVAGDPDEFGALSMTMNLEGGRSISQRLATEDLPASTGNVAWWEGRCLPLKGLQNLTLTDVVPAAWPLPRELVEGTVPEWLQDQVSTFDLTVTAKASGVTADGGTTIKDMPVEVRIICTDGDSRVYRHITAGGETAPAGLAAAVFAALSRLQYSGRLVYVQDECGGVLRPGYRLNVLGGRAEWATMGEAIASVTEDIDRGRTHVEFGPPVYLSPADWLELCRAMRIRGQAVSAQRRVSGVVDADAPLDGGPGPVRVPGAGLVPYEKLTIAGYGGAKIVLDPTQGTHRQVYSVVETNGVREYKPDWVRARPPTP
jgi:hypothetical protein